jgi:RNA polymerase sigma factor (sigma-70 family)
MAKEFYITLKGVKHVVTEEVYRAYICPFWKDKKRRQRQTADHSIALSLNRLIEESDGEFDIADGIDIAEDVTREQLRAEVRRIILQLPETDKAILLGYYLSEKTERELAFELGMCQKTVNNKRHRLLGKLRENDRLVEINKNL